MHKLKMFAVVLSIAVLSVVTLSTGQPVGAAGSIESSFSMLPNPAFTSPTAGGAAIGTGEFKLDADDLDDLKFELDVEATGLLPNTLYEISITVREGFTNPGVVVPVASVVVGSAVTNAQGDFAADGTGVIPNVFGTATPGDEWRIDQQILLPGVGTTATCVNCVLVCAPTTKIVFTNDGELAVSGSDADDAVSSQVAGANHLSRTVFENVSSDISYVNVINNDSGPKLILVVVNGDFAGIDRVEPGVTVSIDISSQMEDGSDNEVAISIVARPGSTTKVWLSSEAAS